MRDLFPGHFRPTDEEFKALWAEATFVVDANVLLNLYRYPKGASDSLVAAFREIQSRLWIPHQVALEFQENRLSVIGEQIGMFGRVKSALDTAMSALTKAFEDLQL